MPKMHPTIGAGQEEVDGALAAVEVAFAEVEVGAAFVGPAVVVVLATNQADTASLEVTHSALIVEVCKVVGLDVCLRTRQWWKGEIKECEELP